METRINRLIKTIQNAMTAKRLIEKSVVDSQMRLQEQLDFLVYIKTGKKPIGISGICHLI